MNVSCKVLPWTHGQLVVEGRNGSRRNIGGCQPLVEFTIEKVARAGREEPTPSRVGIGQQFRPSKGAQQVQPGRVLLLDFDLQRVVGRITDVDLINRPRSDITGRSDYLILREGTQ